MWSHQRKSLKINFWQILFEAKAWIIFIAITKEYVAWNVSKAQQSYKLDAGLVDSDEKKMFFSFYLIICSPLLNYEYY